MKSNSHDVMLVKVWAVLVVVAFGCGGSQRAGRVAMSEPSLKLIDPGAVPRRLLRYELTAHVPERMEMTSKLRSNTTFTNTTLETADRSADFPGADRQRGAPSVRGVSHARTTAESLDGSLPQAA